MFGCAGSEAIAGQRFAARNQLKLSMRNHDVQEPGH
jgi:hypothetical protein